MLGRHVGFGPRAYLGRFIRYVEYYFKEDDNNLKSIYKKLNAIIENICCTLA